MACGKNTPLVIQPASEFYPSTPELADHHEGFDFWVQGKWLS